MPNGSSLGRTSSGWDGPEAVEPLAEVASPGLSISLAVLYTSCLDPPRGPSDRQQAFAGRISGQDEDRQDVVSPLGLKLVAVSECSGTMHRERSVTVGAMPRKVRSDSQ